MIRNRNRTPSDRKVHIGVDNDGNTIVDHDPVHVCRHEADQVVWIGRRNFTVDFGSRSPFSKNMFTGGPGNPAESGPAVRGRVRNFYKYTVQAKGAKPMDPGVGTDP